MEIKLLLCCYLVKHETYKSSDISTDRLTHKFNLADNDPNLVAFHIEVEEMIKHAMSSTHGKFSEFTTPLLTQTDLIAITNKFKVALPSHYEIISILLNKTVSVCLSNFSIGE